MLHLLIRIYQLEAVVANELRQQLVHFQQSQVAPDAQVSSTTELGI